MAFQVQQAQRSAEVAAANALGAANAVREEAKGAADALRTKGQAQAEYNEKVSRSLTPILVQASWIEAWRSGARVPQVVTGTQGGIFLQMPMPRHTSREKSGDDR